MFLISGFQCFSPRNFLSRTPTYKFVVLRRDKTQAQFTRLQIRQTDIMSSTALLLLIACFAMAAHARPSQGPDQLIPLLFSSVNADESSAGAPASGQHRVIQVVEHIIK